jgi:hypothetical protein
MLIIIGLKEVAIQVIDSAVPCGVLAIKIPHKAEEEALPRKASKS